MRLVLILLLAWPCSGVAEECLKNVILWPQVDQPPYRFVLTSTPFLNAGVFQLQQQDLINYLPCVTQHKNITVNYGRAVELLKTGQPVLMLGLVKTQDRVDSGLLYSQFPSLVILTNRLVVTHQSHQYFLPYMKNNTLDLTLLLNSQTDFLIGISTGMQYHGVIDDALRDKPNSRNWYRRSALDIGGLYAMLKKGRISALLDAGPAMVYWGRQNLFLKQLKLVSIKGMPELGELYAVAPDNAWGQQQILLIDNFLQQADAIRRAATRYQQWLPDEDTKRVYWQRLSRHYQQQYGIDLSY